MFGALKTGFKFVKVQTNLSTELKIELNDVPDPSSIRTSFATLTGQGSSSSEASAALFYYLVVRNFLREVDNRRLIGESVDPISLVPLTDICDKANDWLEKAPDRVIFFEIALHSVYVETEFLFRENGIRSA